jgi:hypothetical protein
VSFNPYPDEGYNRFGMIRGTGQLQKGSPYLDQPQQRDDQSEFEDEATRRRKQMQQALLMQNAQMPTPGGHQAGKLAEGGGWKGAAIGAAQGALAGGAPSVGTAQPAMGMSREERDKLQWGSAGRMRGFEVGSDYGGDLKARNSLKNTMGKLFSNYESTPENLRMIAASEEFKRLAPNARLIDHETDPKIDFGGQLSDYEEGVPVGIVDVLEKSGMGGWQWLDESNADMGGGLPQMAPAMGGAPQGSQQELLMQALLQGAQLPEGQVSIEQLLQAILNGNQTEDELGLAGIL